MPSNDSLSFVNLLWSELGVQVLKFLHPLEKGTVCLEVTCRELNSSYRTPPAPENTDEASHAASLPQ